MVTLLIKRLGKQPLVKLTSEVFVEYTPIDYDLGMYEPIGILFTPGNGFL